MRPLPYALAAAALLAAGPARATVTCNLIADPAGDGAPAGVAAVAGSRLDIVSGDVASGATTVVAVLRLRSLDADALAQAGNKFDVGWEVGGARYHVTARTPALGPDTYTASFSGGSGAPALAVDDAAGTLTWTVPRSWLPTLTAGATFSLFTATTSAAGASADSAIGTGTYTDQAPSCVPAA